MPSPETTLRSLKCEYVIVECKTCRMHGELERKALVTKFKASVTLTRLRQTVVGRCERMCFDGVYQCDARVTAKKSSISD